MSTEPTPPSAPKPQLPPASGAKPSLPQAPKLGLAGTKPAFKPEPAATSEGDPFATDTVARPVTAPALQRPPSIGNASPTPTAATATRAPFAGSTAPFAQPAFVPVADESPSWAGAVAGLGLVASLAAVVLIFLELKPTL